MTTIQKWLTGLIGLGALYLVAAPDSHFATGLNAVTNFFTATEHTALTGQA